MLVINELNIPSGADSSIVETFNLVPHQKCDVLLVYGRLFTFIVKNVAK